MKYSLNTGGKGIAGVKNLWEISAGAMNEEVNAPGYGGIPSSQDVGAIPPEQISVGSLGQLGNDGNLYVLLPDGDPAATLLAAGAGFAGVTNIAATKYGHITYRCNATTPTNRYRLTLGVGEQVEMYWNPKTWWSCSGGGLVEHNPWLNALFIAPGTAGKATVTGTITFTNGNPPVSDKVEFTVVEPSSIKATIRGLADLFVNLPRVGAGMQMDVVLQPTTVSFSQVEIEEPEEPTTTTGYFTNHTAPSHKDWGANAWHPVGDNNLVVDGAFDHAFDALGWPVGVSGTYTWPIHPLWRVVNSNTNHPLSGWTDQVFTLSSDGTVRIDKLDHHVTRGPNEPRGTAQ